VKRTGKVGSIHYDESLVLDLWGELASYSDAKSSSFKIHHDSSTTEFESREELESGTLVPNRSTRFELTIHAADGRVRLKAGPGQHRFSISGDEDWVRRTADFLREFNSERENRVRTRLTNKRLLFVQSALFGAIIAMFHNKITAILVSFYYVELPGSRQWTFLTMLLGIGLIEVSKRVYPEVVFRRKSTKSRVERSVFAITMTAAVISIVQGVRLFL
jgi:hypothetical protein